RHAGQTLQDLVETAFVAERPLVAVPGEPGIDEARIELLEARIVDAEPRRHRGPEILDEHIGALDHAIEDREPVLLLQVERNRALAAVRAKEKPRFTLQA